MPRKTFTHDGKRYFVRGTDDEDIAAKIALKKRDLDEGKIVIGKDMLVKDWSTEWLKTYKKGSVTKSTYSSYESRLKSHILPEIGGLKIRSVKQIHCQKILNNLIGYSKEYINKISYTMYQMFSAAKENSIILNNPAENLKKPKAENGTRRAITEKERKLILKLAETHEHGLWIKVMLYCGPRPGETALIQGRHIDLKNNILRIEGTKTANANRLVPIPKVLADDLQKIKIEAYEYLFTNQRGNQLTRSNLQSMWEAFKKSMNVAMGCKIYRNQVMPLVGDTYPVANDLVPYCLRHTYCTDLQSAGVPINVAKELMGHSDISVTARIYTHHSEIAFNNAAEMINNLHNPADKTSELTPKVAR